MTPLDFSSEPELPIPGNDIGPLRPWSELRASLTQQADIMETRWSANRARNEAARFQEFMQ